MAERLSYEERVRLAGEGGVPCDDCGRPVNRHDPKCRVIARPDFWQPGDGKKKQRVIEAADGDDDSIDWAPDAELEADHAAGRSWDLHLRTLP